jgi:hypothetical protein
LQGQDLNALYKEQQRRKGKEVSDWIFDIDDNDSSCWMNFITIVREKL